MRERYAWRSLMIAILLAFVAGTVILQIVRIQTGPEAAVFRAQGADYARVPKTFFPERGVIYDRNGHMLAGNQTVFEVGVQLSDAVDKAAIAVAVADVLGINEQDVLSKLEQPPSGLAYVVLDDYVGADQAAQLTQLQQASAALATQGRPNRLRGLTLTPHPQRDYPEGSLASNVLGFVSREGRGYFGVEEKYNSLLAGKPVRLWVPTDPNKAGDIPRVPDGTTLVLTIDRELQASVEQILDAALAKYGAEHGTIIALNPRDGSILALASSPRMDPNQFWNYGVVFQNASEFDRALSFPYEPGSVFKVLTMATALDTGTVVPTTPFLDTGAIQVGGATIHNWDDQAWGQQDMVGCLQHSLNVCLASVAESVGAQAFYRYMDRFGIGHLTGVDLAGEAAGRLKVPGDSDWYPVDLATNSFGQGVSVTPLQLISAITAVANDGRMVVPHVLYAMVRDGRQYRVPAQYSGSPISPETAHTLSQMLATSLENEFLHRTCAGLSPGRQDGHRPDPWALWVRSGADERLFCRMGPRRRAAIYDLRLARAALHINLGLRDGRPGLCRRCQAGHPATEYSSG